MNIDIDALKRDRLRYTKNKASANLAYLAILFNVFYFVSIYSSDVGNYYYTITMGISVVYNLLFLLIAFLASEGLKSYKLSYAIIIAVIGWLQQVRILGYPLQASLTQLSSGGSVMGLKQFLFTVLWLTLSSACCIASGVIGIVRTLRLRAHLRSIGEA